MDGEVAEGSFHEWEIRGIVLDIGDSEVATTTYKGSDRWIVMVK